VDTALRGRAPAGRMCCSKECGATGDEMRQSLVGVCNSNGCLVGLLPPFEFICSSLVFLSACFLSVLSKGSSGCEADRCMILYIFFFAAQPISSDTCSTTLPSKPASQPWWVCHQIRESSTAQAAVPPVHWSLARPCARQQPPPQRQQQPPSQRQ
jgi:hypothetical protein